MQSARFYALANCYTVFRVCICFQHFILVFSTPCPESSGVPLCEVSARLSSSGIVSSFHQNYFPTCGEHLPALSSSDHEPPGRQQGPHPTTCCFSSTLSVSDSSVTAKKHYHFCFFLALPFLLTKNSFLSLSILVKCATGLSLVNKEETQIHSGLSVCELNNRRTVTSA